MSEIERRNRDRGAGFAKPIFPPPIFLSHPLTLSSLLSDESFQHDLPKRIETASSAGVAIAIAIAIPIPVRLVGHLHLVRERSAVCGRGEDGAVGVSVGVGASADADVRARRWGLGMLLWLLWLLWWLLIMKTSTGPRRGMRMVPVTGTGTGTRMPQGR